MRVEQNYDHQTYEDLYGNRGTFAHNPRMCLKGLYLPSPGLRTLSLKGAVDAEGVERVDGRRLAGADARNQAKYKLKAGIWTICCASPGIPPLPMSPKALIVIATRYSGEAGRRRLREQGYPPEMIEMMKGAGVRIFKHRAGMPVLGIIGKMVNTRFNGGCHCPVGYLDPKVGPDQAQGGRYWSNYTWHGDQDPSHPWWNGTQESRYRPSDMRFSKLNTSWGKNFVENKMPEAHWKLECIERGARVVVITPEYNPTASRADYWIPFRPGNGRRIVLGRMKIIVDENMHDMDYIKDYTECPILVRTDTLQYLDPRDVIKDYKFPDFSKSYSGPGPVAEAGTNRAPRRHDGLGSAIRSQAVPLHREQVGWHYQKSGIDAALDRDLSGEVAQRPRSRRDAGVPDVPGALAGLRLGYRASDLPHAEGPHRPLGT